MNREELERSGWARWEPYRFDPRTWEERYAEVIERSGLDPDDWVGSFVRKLTTERACGSKEDSTPSVGSPIED